MTKVSEADGGKKFLSVMYRWCPQSAMYENVRARKSNN
jgi:hypothetical protein